MMNDTTAANEVTQVNVAPPDLTGKRVYKVRNILDGSVRLVLAQTPAQAARHVSKDTFDITIPSTVEAVQDAKLHNIEIEEA